MSTHNIGFYEEISKIILYHQIHTLSLLCIYVGRRRSEEQLPFSDVWELYKKVHIQKNGKG